MEYLLQSLAALEEINHRYGLPNDELAHLEQAIHTEKVCAPVIGKFSSGKSALLNTLLGYREHLLKEDILPETALPTELLFSEDGEHAELTYSDGAREDCSIEEYRTKELNAAAMKSVRLLLNNQSLSQIRDIMLVDMPGFDSGLEIHNKAIDGYLPKSLAYIIVFPADDMVLKSTMGDILKELSLHDMVFCVVITKCDKVDIGTYRNNVEDLKKKLAKYIGDQEPEFLVTSSRKGDVRALTAYLQKLQAQSQALLTRRFQKDLAAYADETERHLHSLIVNNELSESDYGSREKALTQERNELLPTTDKRGKNFDAQLRRCIEEIKADVLTSLNAEESTLVTIVMNHQNISERVNTVVRSSVTRSVQQRYVPLVQQYIEDVSGDIHINADTITGIGLTIEGGRSGKGLVGPIVAGVAGLLLGLPILGGLAAFLLYHANSKKREQLKAQVQQRLRSEVFPQVIQQVGAGIEREILSQSAALKEQLAAKVADRSAQLDKELADLREQMQADQAEKAERRQTLQADIDRLEEIKNGICE